MIRPLASFGSGLQTQLEAVNFPVGIRRAISADAHAPDMLILGVCQRSALRVEEVLCQLEGIHIIAHGVRHITIPRQPDRADRLAVLQILADVGAGSTRIEARFTRVRHDLALRAQLLIHRLVGRKRRLGVVGCRRGRSRRVGRGGRRGCCRRVRCHRRRRRAAATATTATSGKNSRDGHGQAQRQFAAECVLLAHDGSPEKRVEVAMASKLTCRVSTTYGIFPHAGSADESSRQVHERFRSLPVKPFPHAQNRKALHPHARCRACPW